MGAPEDGDADPAGLADRPRHLTTIYGTSPRFTSSNATLSVTQNLSLSEWNQAVTSIGRTFTSVATSMGDAIRRLGLSLSKVAPVTTGPTFGFWSTEKGSVELGVDRSPGSDYCAGMTMTLEATIREHTCRLCGEEFPTVAETVNHDCYRGPSSAQGRLNALLDGRADGTALREVENLHRDRVDALTEDEAAQMIRQILGEDRTARLDAAVAAVTAQRPVPANARPNRYEARCADCGAPVEVGAGWITRGTDGWETRHVADCALYTPPPAAARFTAEDGQVHSVNGTYYRVRQGRTSRRIYAQRAYISRYAYRDGRDVSVSWTFERGALRLLTAETLLTWEQARDFGILTSQCVRCSRSLEDVRSVAAGYGPVCAAHMGWPIMSEAEAIEAIASRTGR